jgi:hypothetical protein
MGPWLSVHGYTRAVVRVTCPSSSQSHRVSLFSPRYVTRKKAKQSRVPAVVVQTHELTEEEKSAVKIQAIYRGHAVRKNPPAQKPKAVEATTEATA